MNIKLIKPKKRGTSDKFSWKIYQFLHGQIKDKHHGQYVENQIRVYWITRSKWDGTHLAFDPQENLDMQQIVISPLGGKNTGFFSSEIFNRGKPNSFWMPYAESEMIDITDWFFAEYEKRGRCLFYGHENTWLVGTTDRYTLVNNTRKCNWCEEWQKSEVVTTKKITRETVWSSI